MPPTFAPGAYLYAPQPAPSSVTRAPVSFNLAGSAIALRLPPRSSARPSSSAPMPADSTMEGPLHQSANVNAQDTFFDELYEAITMPATSSSTAAMTTEPAATVSMHPPRSTVTFTNLTAVNDDPSPGPDPMDEVLAWAIKQSGLDPQIQTSRTFCTQPDCPMAQRCHLEGIYIHEGIPSPSRLEMFGRSNPPPSVWKAIYNGCNWVGTQEDADRISRFMEYHAIGGNFLIAPHTNFLWGEEVNTPYAVAGAPVVSLPFPALPCRIYFDASPNLIALPELPYNQDIDNPTFRRCVDPICPIVGEHSQGKYLHNGEPPRILSVAFGHSNPPPEIWAALERAAGANHHGLRASNADRWTVLHFQKLHVSGVVGE
ncbi:MAG: hypothetical protein Q9208_004252 [Pyrenodesmia sp. 3 TL-2023]